VPGLSKVIDLESPALISPVSKPLSSVAVWVTVSSFWKTTVVPFLTVISAGVNLKALIVTFVVSGLLEACGSAVGLAVGAGVAAGVEAGAGFGDGDIFIDSCTADAEGEGVGLDVALAVGTGVGAAISFMEGIGVSFIGASVDVEAGVDVAATLAEAVGDVWVILAIVSGAEEPEGADPHPVIIVSVSTLVMRD
jgi:hypothetical protein